jgi:hypothetical protein
LNKPFHPLLVIPGCLIAIWPFRYVWNNPPHFVGRNIWLALLTPIAVFIVVSLGITCLITICWRLWKAK